jgi:hypothetical protein
MSRNKIITYAIDGDTGCVVSRVGSEVAIDVLDFEGMTPQNGYDPKYNLEKHSVYDTLPHMPALKWTKKIPLEEKNRHRGFWGMKPLKD